MPGRRPWRRQRGEVLPQHRDLRRLLTQQGSLDPQGLGQVLRAAECVAVREAAGGQAAVARRHLLVVRTEGSHDEARVWHRGALEVQQRSSDVAAQAWSMICLGVQDLSEGRFEDGERWVHRGRALARTIGDERLQRIAVQCLGTSQA
jgi:hypothetical protein